MIGDAVAATENFRHVNSEQQKVIITQKRRLEEVTARAEEADMYKEKAHELMELIAGMGGAPPGGAPPPPPPPPPLPGRATPKRAKEEGGAPSSGGGSVLGNLMAGAAGAAEKVRGSLSGNPPT